MRLFKFVPILMSLQIMVIGGCGGGGSGSSGSGGAANDTSAPTITTFSMPSSATSLTVSVSGLTATDNVGVTGYMITESATPPVASASGWAVSVPASFTFSAAGNKTAYAWAKDAAGNVSSSQSVSVTITQQRTLITSISGIPPNAQSIEIALDFTNAVGYDFSGYIDSSGDVISSYIAASISGAVAGNYDSVNKKMSLGVANSSVISDGTISLQFQAVPGFDVTKIIATVTEITDGSGAQLPVTGATTILETVQ